MEREVPVVDLAVLVNKLNSFVGYYLMVDSSEKILRLDI